MTDHLTPENVELVRKALGHCLGRTFNRYEVNRIIDAARSAGPVSSGEGTEEEKAASQGCGYGHSGSRDEPTVGATAALAPYDAGLLSDYGGGNVDWWQDYLRAQLGAAHDFYQAQVADMRLAVAWAKTFGEAHDAMQDALIAISRHADNQDIGHIDFRMHAKQQADFTLEQCAGSPGLLDPAPTPKPDWTRSQWLAEAENDAAFADLDAWIKDLTARAEAAEQRERRLRERLKRLVDQWAGWDGGGPRTDYIEGRGDAFSNAAAALLAALSDQEA